MAIGDLVGDEEEKGNKQSPNLDISAWLARPCLHWGGQPWLPPLAAKKNIIVSRHAALRSEASATQHRFRQLHEHVRTRMWSIEVVDDLAWSCQRAVLVASVLAPTRHRAASHVLPFVPVAHTERAVAHTTSTTVAVSEQPS